MKYGLQLLTANKFSLFHWGCGVREQWCIAHPCLVWENLPCGGMSSRGPLMTDHLAWAKDMVTFLSKLAGGIGLY